MYFNNNQSYRPMIPLSYRPQNQLRKKKLSLEYLLLQMRVQLKGKITSIRNLEIKLRQLANNLATRPLDMSPSNIEINPEENDKEQC